MKTIEQIFGTTKIAPTVSLEQPSNALAVAEALLNGGVNVMAIRILSRNSLKSLELISKALPEMTAGAGAIMDAAGFLNASIAGAKFISSPGATQELLTASRTRYNDAHFLPGVLTPTQVMEVMTRGIDVMNLFPAEVLNGYELVKTYSHTFPSVRFTMIGGIGLNNVSLAKYLTLPNVVAVGVSEIATKDLIETANYAEITLRAEKAMEIARSIIEKKS